MNDRRDKGGEQAQQLRDKLQEYSDNIKTVSKDLRECKAKMQTFLDEREQLAFEQSELFQKKTQLELTITDLTSEVEGEKDARVCL